MYVAVLAVMVTVSAIGAVMRITPAGAVTAMVGDIGAVISRSAPYGPVLVKLHVVGDM